jgi:hypothetical protein
MSAPRIYRFEHRSKKGNKNEKERRENLDKKSFVI